MSKRAFVTLYLLITGGSLIGNTFDYWKSDGILLALVIGITLVSALILVGLIGYYNGNKMLLSFVLIGLSLETIYLIVQFIVLIRYNPSIIFFAIIILGINGYILYYTTTELKAEHVK